MTAPVDHVKLSGADTLWSFVLKAVDRLDLLYPIRACLIFLSRTATS